MRVFILCLILSGCAKLPGPCDAYRQRYTLTQGASKVLGVAGVGIGTVVAADGGDGISKDAAIGLGITSAVLAALGIGLAFASDEWFSQTQQCHQTNNLPPVSSAAPR